MKARTSVGGRESRRGGYDKGPGAGMVMSIETGTNARRNLRFRVVTLPEPSILTQYLS